MDGVTLSQRLRILIALETAGGGSGRHVIDLTEGLTKRGHHVVVAYSPVRAEATFVKALNRIRAGGVVEVPMARSIGFHDLTGVWQLYDAARRHGPFDVLHGHSSKAGALSRLLPLRSVRVYTPHAFRTMDPALSKRGRVLFGQVERLLATSFTDAVVLVSSAELAHARELGLPASKLRIIVNGVSKPPDADRASIRRELGQSAEDVVIGFVGRLAYQKAPERFVRIVAELAPEFPHLKAVMLGDGEQKAEIVNLIESEKIGDRIRLVSGLDAQLYVESFDILVMTSRYEAMPYVLLEGLAAGIPIVTTSVGGAVEAVQHGKNGYIVDGQDVVSNLTASVRILVGNPALRAQMAQSALERAREFSIDRMVAETESLYRELISRKYGRGGSFAD